MIDRVIFKRYYSNNCSDPHKQIRKLTNASKQNATVLSSEKMRKDSNKETTSSPSLGTISVQTGNI